ncbi:MAG TPA: ClpXP protease specificity-enhancing factor SspB, partial [Stellaceae bacterium]|nr:ClpXP protease specificity-enhancing factor SspB [Stellaceae bacterium]
MVEAALRGVVREALARTAVNGLPGAHHFYITFRTRFPGLALPDYLAAQYPEEMTVVIEHQFWDLEVTEERFSVTLSFQNRPERLTIPFDAITA